MASPIERLPVELIDLIVAHLPLPDYGSLRSASHQLYNLTLSTFSTCYFKRRVTTLGVPSLNRLLESSAHPTFANSVTLLDVKLLNHEDYQNLRKIHRVGIYPPPKRLPKVSQVKNEDISQESELFDYMRDHQDPKAVIHPLGRAIKRFRNLRVVRLRVNGTWLYSSPCIMPEDEIYQAFLSACFKAILDAIIRSGVKLKEFGMVKGTTIRPLTKSSNIIYPVFNLPFPALVSLQNAFSSLKTLRLSILTNYNGKARVPGWENGVSQFISAVPTLENLTLCLQATDGEPCYRAAVMRSVCRTVQLPALNWLQLYGCAVDELDLVTLIKTHASTLRRLFISDTDLQTGTWASVVGSFRENLDLEYIRLQYLQQSPRPQSILWGGEGLKNRNKLIIESRDREWVMAQLPPAIASLVAAAEADIFKIKIFSERAHYRCPSACL
jgi:hypothetical protein